MLAEADLRADPVWIGKPVWVGPTGIGSFNGAIDEVRIWGEALSADQVSALYQQEKPN
jgi:hypothetical protein